MTITPDHERPRAARGSGFADAVTMSFGDAGADIYGIARVAIAEGADGEQAASGLVILFAGREPVAVRAEADVPLREAAWEAIEVAGTRTAVVEPLAAWRVSFRAQDGNHAFDLELFACSAPAELAAGDPAARLGGMEGYEQLCRVTGTVTVGGQARTIDCLGQRGHSWGAPDWDRVGLARTMSAWLDEGLAIAVTAVRPAHASGHDAEAIAAYLLEAGPEAVQATAQRIGDPRLSTLYDGEGRQRRAGLELYVDEDDDHARRLAGDAVCGTSLDLGKLRLDCAFFKWHMEGRTGVGRYDILRHGPPAGR